MRLLTDPREIKAFRKKQLRKILNLLRSDFITAVPKLRRVLIEVSICSACLAAWVFLFVAIVALSDIVIPGFIVNG